MDETTHYERSFQKELHVLHAGGTREIEDMEKRRVDIAKMCVESQFDDSKPHGAKSEL